MLRLEPTPHSLPDNIWHTLLITGVAAFLVWAGWTGAIEALTAEAPVNATESRLLEGEGHGLYLVLEEVTDRHTPLRWNRAVSAVGWGLSLFMMARVLTRLAGFLACLPSLILLMTFPELTLRMASAGSGSWGAFLFLLAFSALLLEDARAPWVRGGVYAGLAVILSPVWFPASVGLLLGVWEVNRPVWRRAAIGYAAGLAVGVIALGAALPGGWQTLSPGPAAGEGWAGIPWTELLERYFFLWGGLVLMIGYGARRRGMGWWCVMGALAWVPFFRLSAGEPMAVWVPVLITGSLGLAKLPTLLDVRHPRAYQTVLLCQLWVWLPLI